MPCSPVIDMADKPSQRERMVQATVTLLRQGGLAGASLNRTLEESGAPKGSLYHYFPGGKDELIGAALQHFADDFAQLLGKTWRLELPFEERWGNLIDAMVRGLRRSDYTLGCPVAATLLDLQPEDQAVRAIAQAALDRWIDLMAAGLQVPRKNARAFAEALLALLEGALVLVRAQRSDRPLLSAKAFGLAAYKQL
jgi:TetR/AcrR family transcriptional repressor of lmrAB and yxaGH operons